MDPDLNPDPSLGNPSHPPPPNPKEDVDGIIKETKNAANAVVPPQDNNISPHASSTENVRGQTSKPSPSVPNIACPTVLSLARQAVAPSFPQSRSRCRGHPSRRDSWPLNPHSPAIEL